MSPFKSVTLAVAIVSSITSTLSYSQHSLPRSNLTLPVLLHSNKDGYGSGFYYRDSSYVYFVTAHHVIFNLGNSIFLADTVELTSHAGDPEEATNVVLALPLQTMRSNGLIRTDSTHDITAIRIGKWFPQANGPGSFTFLSGVIRRQLSKSGILTVSPSDMSPYDSVHLSDDVFVMGYPRAIGVDNFPQIDYSRPLLRRGIVSGKNDKFRTIILDCQVHGGNSGGPVIEVVDKSSNSTEFRIVGIVTQYVPWLSSTLTRKDTAVTNSGYSVAVPMDVLFTLLHQWN